MTYRFPQGNDDWESDSDEGETPIFKENEPDRTSLIQAFDNDLYDELGELLNYKYEVLPKLFEYCIKNNDTEFINKLIEKHEKYDLFGDGSMMSFFLVTEIVKCNTDILNILFDMECFKSKEAKRLFYWAINDANIDIINRLESLGHKMGRDDFKYALLSGNNNIIQHIIPLCDNLQNVFDDCFSSTMGYFHVPDNLIQKLNTVIELGIDISKKLDVLLIECIKKKKNDDAIFCHQQGATNIDEAFKIACYYSNDTMMLYLLENGADINVLTKKEFRYIDHDIAKILFDYNYVFKDDELEYIMKTNILTQKFKDFEILFDYIKNNDYIFKNEEYFTNNKLSIKDINDRAYGMLDGDFFDLDSIMSILEYLVHKNKIEHIKFIIMHDLNRLDINKLFVIASANGRLELAKLFFELDNNVNVNLALECACFFGHVHMVKYLLDFNVFLSDELFLMCTYGTYYKLQRVGYAKILEKIDIINDIFMFGESYTEIFKLLIQCDLIMPLNLMEMLGIEHFCVEIMKHFIECGQDPTELLTMFLQKELFPYHRDDLKINKPLSENVISVTKYLSENSSKINYDHIVNVHMIELLKEYFD